jgi:hypothetical protein
MDRASEAGRPSRDRLLTAASLLLLALYFIVSSRHGWRAYFTQDDAGNLLAMHNYWQHSLLDEIWAALRVVSGMVRPLGAIFYFTLYKLAGYNPLPFRAVCLTLILANLLLAFALLRRLSGSIAAALFGGIILANHPALLELFYSSGTIYEILCFLFYFLAVWLYLGWRQAGVVPSWRRLAILLALTGLALDSKEMAMTLPGALLLVELIYVPKASRSWRGALLTAMLVVPTVLVKALTHNPLSNDPAYAGHSLHGLLEAMRAYQNFLLYGDLFQGGLSIAGLLVLWLAMAAAALFLRSRPMIFGGLFLIGSLVPVSLISRRGGYLLYIPLLGWALYIACLFERVFLHHRLSLPIKAAAFAIAAVFVVRLHAAKLAPYAAYTRQEQGDMRRVIDALRKAHPRLPRGATLLLTDDLLPPILTLDLLAPVAYGDPTLELERIKMRYQPLAGDDVTHFDYVLGGGWKLRDIRGPSDPRPPVTLAQYAGQTVDLRIRTSSARTIVRNCKLDAAGRPAIAGPIEIHWIRPAGGEWMSVSPAP